MLSNMSLIETHKYCKEKEIDKIGSFLKAWHDRSRKSVKRLFFHSVNHEECLHLTKYMSFTGRNTFLPPAPSKNYASVLLNETLWCRVELQDLLPWRVFISARAMFHTRHSLRRWKIVIWNPRLQKHSNVSAGNAHGHLSESRVLNSNNCTYLCEMATPTQHKVKHQKSFLSSFHSVNCWNCYTLASEIIKALLSEDWNTFHLAQQIAFDQPWLK